MTASSGEPTPYVAFYEERGCMKEFARWENPAPGCHRMDKTPPGQPLKGAQSVYHTLPKAITVWDSKQDCTGDSEDVPSNDCRNLKFLSFYFSYEK
jgi:hypothetical protein